MSTTDADATGLAFARLTRDRPMISSSHFRANIRFIATHFDTSLRRDFLRTVGLMPSHMCALLTGERLPNDILRRMICHYVGLKPDHPICEASFDAENREVVMKRLQSHQRRVHRMEALRLNNAPRKRGPKRIVELGSRRRSRPIDGSEECASLTRQLVGS